MICADKIDKRSYATGKESDAEIDAAWERATREKRSAAMNLASKALRKKYFRPTKVVLKTPD